jgi:putative restriction endonuclease
MANAIFTTKVNPSYNDLPEIRYHFPQTYLNQARETLGDWIVYYEPRREDALPSGRAGRQAYFATARVRSIEQDPHNLNLFYAYVQDYLEFARPVPFKDGGYYPESILMKANGSTNKGAFGRAVRILPHQEYQLIVSLGFADRSYQDMDWSVDMAVAEELAEFVRSDKTQILKRPFREAAFTKTIQQAYDFTCAMTGLKLINGGGRCEIEAAHIRPVAKDGPDSARNGIALSRTVHWMFDRGIISLEDDGRMLLAKKLVPNQVQRMLNPEGRINLPQDRMMAPHPVFLRFHRENIFKGD